MVRKEIIQSSRILIVDDNASNLMLLEAVLEEGGYTNFSKTTDPRQVLEFFNVYQPDLIMLDLMMPYLDGFSLMTQLRSRIPDNTYLPILVLTANVAHDARKKALSLGAKDFLTKPFDNSEVLLRTYNLLETRWFYLQIQQQVERLEDQSAEWERMAREVGVAETHLEQIRQRLRTNLGSSP